VIPAKMEGQRNTSEPFNDYEFLPRPVVIQKNDKPPYDLMIGPCPQKSRNCSRFSNQNQSNDENHLAIEEHHQVSKNL